MAWSLKNFACMVSIFIFLEFIFYNIHNICKSKHLNMEIFLYIFWNFYILSLGCYKLKKNTLMKIPGKRADLCQCVCVCVCARICVLCLPVCLYLFAVHIFCGWIIQSLFPPFDEDLHSSFLQCTVLLCGLLFLASENNLGETETENLIWPEKSFLHFFVKCDQSSYFYIRIKSQRQANPGKMWT